MKGKRGRKKRWKRLLPRCSPPLSSEQQLKNDFCYSQCDLTSYILTFFVSNVLLAIFLLSPALLSAVLLVVVVVFLVVFIELRSHLLDAVEIVDLHELELLPEC